MHPSRRRDDAPGESEEKGTIRPCCALASDTQVEEPLFRSYLITGIMSRTNAFESRFHFKLVAFQRCRLGASSASITITIDV